MSSSADIPIPSIEDARDENANLSPLSRSTQSSPASTVLTPASTLDLTQPPQTPRREGSRSSTGLRELGDRMAGVNLSSPSPARSAPRPSLTPGSRSRVGRRSMTAAPHNVADEEPPENARRLPRTQEAVDSAKALMRDITSTLGQSALVEDEGSTLHRLQRDAAKLADYKISGYRIVAFVGVSGAGKSSLLNSLLDIQGLARAGEGSGTACTCVATEYRYHAASTFAIQVLLFSLSEIREQIQPLLECYRHWNLHQDEIEAGDRAYFEKQAKLAWDTFKAMFSDRLGNSLSLLDNSETETLEMLMAWADELRPVRTSEAGSGLDLEECSARLARLSSEDSSQGDPAAWPYIKKIQVFSNAHILSTGLVLADLPGLHDKNFARVRITEKYMLECDEIFAVCRIGRAVTDEGLLNVFRLARITGRRNIGIICTHSDVIKGDEVISDPNWTAQVAEVQRRLSGIKDDETQYEAINGELELFKGLSNDELSEGEGEYRDMLRSTKEQIEERKRQHEFELQKYLIQVRNELVTAGLMREYEAKSGSTSPISVFCVSNDLYWLCRRRAAQNARPTLTLSGILSLRRHCLSLVSESQLRASKRYLQDEVPNLLSKVALWADSGARHGSEERRALAREKIEDVETILKNHLRRRNSAVNLVASNLKREFKDQIYSRRNGSRWSRDAVEAAMDWSTWAHGTYSAFCRNEGDYCTGASGGPRDWNAEAMATMVSELQTPWANLVDRYTVLKDDILDEVDRVTDGAISKFDDLENDSENAVMSRLETVLERQSSLLLDSLELKLLSLGSKLELLRINALTSISSSFIREGMRPAYKSAAMDSGRGSHQRRKDTINGAFGNPELYENVLRKLKDSFHADVEDVQEGVSNSIDEYFDAVGAELDLVREESVARESESDPRFRDDVAAKVREGLALMAGLGSRYQDD